MLDALFIVLSILFFTVATAYVRGCERLLPRSAAKARTGEEPPS